MTKNYWKISDFHDNAHKMTNFGLLQNKLKYHHQKLFPKINIRKLQEKVT